jgi:hypothetical protein
MKARKLTLFYFLFLFSGPLVHGQDNGPAFRRFTSIGCGISYAPTNSWQENKLVPGIHTMLGFHLNRFFYIETASNYYFVHNSIPAFKNIHAWNLELNGHIILPITKTGFFRILLGTTYLEWKGIYSGKGLNGSHPYKEGDLLYTKFFAGNIGVGFTKQIGKRSFIDLSETMRISAQDNKYGLSDISLQLGYRYALQFGNDDSSESKTHKLKTEKGIAKGKYKWMKKKRR